MKLKVLVLATLFASSTFAAKYELDKSHLDVGFSVKHLMISNVKGRFDKVDGTLDFDAAKKDLKEVVVNIDPASINTGNKDRDDHLRSPDFFDVKKYPKMTFKSKKVEWAKDGKTAKITGDLTIKDKTKEVVLDTEYGGEAEMMGTKKVAFSGKAKLNRKDFGLAWNKVLETGGVAVGEEISITIDGEANMLGAAKK